MAMMSGMKTKSNVCYIIYFNENGNLMTKNGFYYFNIKCCNNTLKFVGKSQYIDHHDIHKL